MNAYGIYCVYCATAGCETQNGFICGDPCGCEGSAFCWWCGFNGIDEKEFRKNNKFPTAHK